MGKFDDNKCKTNLKLAIHRMNLLKNQKTNLIVKQERDIAELLRNEKTELARVKVESIIRDDYMVQAFEILELYIELLHTRMPMIKMQKTVPFDLKEAVCTIIYAAPRVEIKELHEVRKQFLNKYGECLIQDAMENRGNCVNPKIVHKLSACAPENYLVFEYLNNIAKKYNVEWCCPYDHSSPIFEGGMIPPSIHQPIQPTNTVYVVPSQFGGNAPPPFHQEERFIPNGGQSVLPGTGYNPNAIPPSSFSSFPSVPSSSSSSVPPPYSPSPNNNDFSFPSVPSSGSSNFPSVPSNQPNNNNFDFPSTPNNGSASGDSDFDDLTARFNRLKKK